MVGTESSSQFEIERSRSIYNSDVVYDEETASITSSSTSSGDSYVSDVVSTDRINKCGSTFGSIVVTNSKDVHFGNKTVYEGPVTIKQFVYPSNSNLSNSEDVVSDVGVGHKIPIESDISVPNTIYKIDLKCVPDNAGIQHSPDVANNESKLNNSEVGHVNDKKGTGWIHDLPRKHIVFIILLSVVLVLSLVISTAVLLTRNPISIANDILGGHSTEEWDSEENFGERPKDNESFVLPKNLKIIPRAEWLAKPPTEPLPSLKLPVPYVIIMHTATEQCTSHTDCNFHVQQIQKFHIDSRKWWDIGYSFLVGGSGYAYEGRGWMAEGAHTYGYNRKSMGIALIGTFTSVLPLPRQILATKKLIERGVELGYIDKNYKLLGARQLQSTESPGKLLFEEIKSWDHWAEVP